MTSLLAGVTILYLCGGFLSAATISKPENESDHSHVAWNFFVPGKKGFQVSTILHNENTIESDYKETGLQQPRQQCQKHQPDHNDYAFNFVLSGIKEIELKSLFDDQKLATIDVTNETHIENLVAKGHIAGLELKTLPAYIEVSDDPKEPQSAPKCPQCEKTTHVTVNGLHWKDWTGKIPPDAIVGDYNIVNGTKTPIYLVQGLLQVKDAGLIPTYITPDSQYAQLPFEGVHNVNTNVKVLCGDQEDVVWVSWPKAAHLNKHKDYVNAGFERTFPLYFARCRHKGQYFFGKVVLRDTGAYFVYENSEYFIKSFDVLCHREALTIDQFVKD